MAEWPQIEQGRLKELSNGKVRVRMTTRHKGKLLRATGVAANLNAAKAKARNKLKVKVENRTRRMIRNALKRRGDI